VPLYQSPPPWEGGGGGPRKPSTVNRFFQKYTGVLRSLKAVYVLNNLLHAGRLKANRALYRRYGLQKSVFGPLGSADFGGKHHPDLPWLDRPGALERLEADPGFAGFAPEVREQLRRFVTDGYMILPGCCGPARPAITIPDARSSTCRKPVRWPTAAFSATRNCCGC
jgi:hypothetical protein